MKRGLVVAISGAAIVATALSGCSKDEKKDRSTETTKSSAASVTAGSATASSGAGAAKVTIDGQPHDVNGQVVCAAAGGNTTSPSARPQPA